MIKISALNEESNDESEEENVATITKEAEEHLALTEYNKALQLLKEDKINDALNIFQDLLETELLDEVEKPVVADGRVRPMLSLKYCCYKNVGNIYKKLGNYDAAIDNYWEAANLDNTDVTLWYTMGLLAMETYNLEFACSALKQALICNPNHWPSLDHIITAMYAIPDYMNCLLYISIALERDPTYIKGLVFREMIFRKVPYFKESYKLFNVDWELDPPLDVKYDHSSASKFLIEAQELSKKWIELCKNDFEYKPLPPVSINVPLKNYTWLELGECLIDTYEYIVKNDINFISKVILEIEKEVVDEKCEQENGEKTVDQTSVECNKMIIDKEGKKDLSEMMILDISSEIECTTEISIKNSTKIEDSFDKNQADIECLLVTDDNKLEPVHQMDVDVIINEDDDKSSSSAIQIEDEEDPLKISSSEFDESGQILNKLNGDEHHNDNNHISNNNNHRNNNSVSSSSSSISNCNNRLIEDDIEIIKLSNDEANDFTEKVTDNELNKNADINVIKSTAEIIHVNDDDDKMEVSDKDKDKDKDNHNNKSNDKIDVANNPEKPAVEMSKPKTAEQQKVKKRRRSSLCFLQQWAWSSSSMRRSARVRGSSRRENEREDVQLEEMMRRLFPQNLLPDSIKLIRDDPLKSIDDSMDTMDLYQLFANQDNSSANNNTNKDDADDEGDDDDEEDLEMSKSSGESGCNKLSGSDVSRQHRKQRYFNTDAEKQQVMDFINEHSGKSNIMVIIGKITEFLAIKWNQVWPNKLNDVYQQLYLFTRQHIPHNDALLWNINNSATADETVLNHDAEMTLLFCELFTDKWLDSQPHANTKSAIDKFGIGLPTEELGYIIFSSVRDSSDFLNNTESLLYLLRVLWVKVNIFLCQNDTKVAIRTLHLILEIMDKCRGNLPCEFSVKLLNCKYNPWISVMAVKKRLVAIERGEKLGQVEKLYAENKFYDLALILKDTFKFGRILSKQKNNEAMKYSAFVNNAKSMDKIDRVKHFSMLLDSLYQLQQYEDCYSWSEVCLNEAWQYYINNVNSEDTEELKKWSESIINCLKKLESCVEMAGTSVSRYLPDRKISRLIQTLVQIICHQLDVPDNTVEMPLETVAPWILLHHILQYQEDKERAGHSRNAQKYKRKNRKSRKRSLTRLSNQNLDDADPNAENRNGYDTDSSSNTIESNPDKENIPPPIMILFIGHDFLGRHSWCCINEAKLLLFTMKTVIPCMQSSRFNNIREKITKHLGQIFWCLYGHPNRANKTKPKHLEDHGVPQIPLTWDIAQLLFEFYKPEILPEFDSPRPLSITADTKILFKKINSLVPPEHDPTSLTEQITAYIVGDLEEMPTVKKPLPYQIDTLYYLLGDYSFKNNNWSSASKYYAMDICLRPNAFNSWVSLAMSLGTLFGTALNNCKPLTDITKLLSQAKIAQCCYRRAVELNPGHSVIWIEYGNFVYTVHSFCSRLLKQETDTFSMEKFVILEKRKDDTLDIAKNCFVSANQIYLATIDDAPQDERWLYHYMLAKIAEKKNCEPNVYLQHYATASELLHKNNAHYPKKISHKNAHYLSIEALEVHYRIHACILKYLEQHENKPLKKSLGMLFWKHLSDCANGPFMQFPSKLRKSKYYRDDDNLGIGTTTIVSAQKNNFGDKSAEIKSPGNEGYEEGNNVIFGGVDTDTDTDAVPKKLPNDSKTSNESEDIIVILPESDNKSAKKRGRPPLDELTDAEITKKVKMSNCSHLQLMQDVVAFIDDLISNVCEIVRQQECDEKQTDSEEIMIISSDECAENGDDNRVSPNHEAEKSAVNHRDPQIGKDKEDGSEGIKDVEQVERIQSGDYIPAAFAISNKDKSVNNKESKYPVTDKKKSQVNTVKDEATMSRRGSQESTTTTLTTTTTETNNSSLSSSDESSSSEDSSDSDSSSADTDSESGESDNNDKKKSDSQVEEKEEEEEEEYFTEAEVLKLIAYCLAGLEQCVLRFPEHYKSIYRLCHFYFNHKSAKDNTKCRDLLLGTYKCQYYNGLTFQGLFADRKNANFFNGVWRIPNDEIDRPGSFASHMSRCVTLLMQVLKETEDSRMLMELCIQLRKTPDPDKKYVRDSEREQLSRQAFSLCLQSLRTRVQSMGSPNPDDTMSLVRNDPRTRVLLDVYKIYQQVQKNIQGKEQQAFATLLVDTYKVYMGKKSSEGNLLEQAIKCCQQQNLANKIAAPSITHSVQASSSISSSSLATNNNNNNNNNIIANATSVITHTTTANNISSISSIGNSSNSINLSSAAASMPPMYATSITTSPQASYQRKTNYKASGTGRPRGRPPNMSKYQGTGQMGGSNNLVNQYNPKRGFANYLDTPGNQPLINPYCMNPLLDQNIIPTLLTAGLAGNMFDPTSVNYLKQLSNYQQDIFRQFQQNLSSHLSSYNNPGINPSVSSANINSMVNMANMAVVQQLLNMNVSSAAAGCTTNTTSMSNVTINPAGTGISNANTGSTSLTTVNTTSALPTSSVAATITPTSHPTEIPHNISITPVNPMNNQHKPLKIKLGPASSNSSGNTASKSVNPHGVAQVSLLKPSVTQQNKPTTLKPSTSPTTSGSSSATVAPVPGQIRVAKNLTEPQPAHNISSLPVSPLKSSSPSSIIPGIASLQNSGLNIKAVPAGMGRSAASSGTSLQHKLQQKKQSQVQSSQPQQQPQPGATRKQKRESKMMSSQHSAITNNYQGISGSSGAMINSFLGSEASGISVSAVGHHGNVKKTGSGKYKRNAIIDITESMQSCLPSNPAVSSTMAESINMLTQLQLHSHLEIIPQTKNISSKVSTTGEHTTKNVPLSLSIVSQKSGPSKNIDNSNMATMHELSSGRAKTGVTSASPKKSNKNSKDNSVEIITLDD